MSIDNVILWYEKNVNYKLTKGFLDFIIKTGIIKEDVDLELLNSFLLETFNNDFVKEGDKFKVKKNRLPVIDEFKAKKIDKAPVTLTKSENKPKTKNKFKIENLGGKRLKLVKIK